MLLGGPVLVIFSIFAMGVSCGVANSESVVGFEARWLGMEPGPGGDADESEPATTEPAKTEPAKTEPAKTEPAKTEPAKTEPAKTEPAKTEPAKTEPAKTEPAKTEPTLPVALAEPLSGDLASLLANTRVVRIKLMVDPALLVTQPEWLGYTADLIESANASFEVLFGIELRLQGIVLWEPAGSTRDALLADLAGRQREGADLIVGLAARPMLGDPPAARDDGVALIYADPDAPDHFHRPLLRGLAASFGAEPIHDPQSAAWRGGSFMSEAPVSSETRPWIDPDNRARVLHNKWSSAAPPPVEEARP